MQRSKRARATRLAVLIASCAIAGVVGAAAPASGLTIRYEVTNWNGFPDNIALPQFNPSNGTLNSVLITMSGDVSASLGLENPTRNTVGVTTTWSAWLSVTDPYGAILATSQAQSAVNTLAAYDGVRDYGGTSGVTNAWADTPSVTNLYTSAAQLALATGLGSLLFPADGNASTTLVGPGNLWQLFTVTTDTSISVTYDYDPLTTVPEPASLVLLTTGLLAAAFRRGRGAGRR